MTKKDAKGRWMLRKTLLGRQVSFSHQKPARGIDRGRYGARAGTYACDCGQVIEIRPSNNDSNQEQSLQVTTCLIDNRQLANDRSRQSRIRGIIILHVRFRGKSRVSRTIEINRAISLSLSLSLSLSPRARTLVPGDPEKFAWQYAPLGSAHFSSYRRARVCHLSVYVFRELGYRVHMRR